MSVLLTTQRLLLRPLTLDDASFIVALLNDPDWLRYIGDRSVRTVGDGRRYLREGPLAMYAREGFGLLLVALRDSGEPIGVCGLIRREGLADVDLGFALLPAYRGRGFAHESAAAVIDDGRVRLGLDRIVAIASPDNERSTRLLARLHFRAEGLVCLPGDSDDVRLFVLDR